MRRRLLVRVLALISVAPSLAAAAMWVRSFWIRDAFPESLHEGGCSIRSWNGRVFILLIKVAKQPGLVVSIITPGIAGRNLSAKKVQIRLMPYASQRRQIAQFDFAFLAPQVAYLTAFAVLFGHAESTSRDRKP